jgi:hypothetical protein
MKKNQPVQWEINPEFISFFKSEKNCDSFQLKCFLRRVSSAYLITLYVLYCLVCDFLRYFQFDLFFD